MPHDDANQSRQDTGGEIFANSISHGLGVMLSLIGVIVLMMSAVKHGDRWQIVSFAIFGSTLVTLYLASTLYHSIPQPKIKQLLQIFDHAAIFLLIAGTYTPFLLVNLRGPWGWSIFGIIWTFAIFGVVLKIFYLAQSEKIALVVYLGMGWLCVIAAKQFIVHVPPFSLGLLVLGGLSYTIGVIFYTWEKLPYHHAVWHIFVLSGSAFHYFSVLSTLR